VVLFAVLVLVVVAIAVVVVVTVCAVRERECICNQRCVSLKKCKIYSLCKYEKCNWQCIKMRTHAN